MKRSNTTVITWTCPECEQETKVTVHAIIPAKVSGPPEDCYPEEGGEIEPDKCEHCGHDIDPEAAYEMASEKERDAREAAAEEKADRLREERAFGIDQWRDL